MKDLFGEEMPEQKPDIRNKASKVNPMLAIYGKTEGLRCKQCSHFYAKRMGNTYFKCDLRKVSNGPATDHRANWPACGKFESQVPETASKKTWYQILKVDKNASEDQIKSAYKSRAKETHPDVTGGSVILFQEVQKAYEEALK